MSFVSAHSKSCFCARVVFKKGQKCHPTWVPSTLGVNKERLGTFLPNFVCAHAFCERGTNAIPHGCFPLLGYIVLFHQDGAILVAP